MVTVVTGQSELSYGKILHEASAIENKALRKNKQENLSEGESMNKMIKAVLSAALISSLYGCASESDQVADTVNSFWAALEKGDLEAAKSYSSETVYEQVDSLGTSISGIISDAEEYNLPEDTAAVIAEFVDHTIAMTYNGHTITSQTKTADDEYEVRASVSVCDSASLEEAIQSIDYGTELDQYQDEILKVMAEEGMEKAYIRMYTILFTYMNEHIEELSSGLRYTDSDVILTVKKQPDKKWLITGMRAADGQN